MNKQVKNCFFSRDKERCTGKTEKKKTDKQGKDDRLDNKTPETSPTGLLKSRFEA